MSLIYVIGNTVNNYLYIGQTNQTLNERLKHHFSNIENGNTQLYIAMKIIGKENFYIDLIEEVDDSLANIRELYWINYYSNLTPLYNMKYSVGKCGGDTLTNHPNIESIKQKIVDKCMGSDNSQSTSIIAKHVLNGGKVIFGSISECQKCFNIPRHDIICRRCNGKIKKPYGNLMFEYNK